MNNLETVKVIPLGGLDEVGKNMTAIEFKDEIIVIDAGTAFPSTDMHGVQLIVPDVEYLKENKDKVKSLYITHGHEDHIGGISYFLNEFNVDIYATKLTMVLIKNKLKGKKEAIKNLKIINRDSVIKGENLTVSFFETNHSIPDSVGLVIETPYGNIVHTSDFKVDYTPIDGRTLDFTRIADIKKHGVLLLLSDSTNALKEGFSPSEEKVANALHGIIKGAKGRVIATTFASSLYRIQSLIRIAELENRKVVLVGRSMKNNVKAAYKLGYINVKEGTFVSDKLIEEYSENELLVITTGSQGESTSALRRMVENKNPYITLNSADTVLFSSHSIPGNEKSVNYLVNELSKLDVKVFVGGEIHTSGHGYQEELKLILSLFKPKFFMPVHGEHRMLKNHAHLASRIGVKKENCFICENGNVLEISKGSVKRGKSVKAGAVLVDQSGLGDVKFNIMKDRERLANHGVAFIQIQKTPHRYKTRVILKGVIAVHDSKQLYREVNSVVEEIMKKNENNRHSSKRDLYKEIGEVLEKHLKRKPLIVPVFD
ncbi:ribonuclease J [Priestia filamentosa]|uniref:ribonuclease J n=1 Tax=Priestia filamentosa TaxID=1402861 RepID=UPI00397AEB8D